MIARGEVPTAPDGFSRLQATYDLAPGTEIALETAWISDTDWLAITPPA